MPIAILIAASLSFGRITTDLTPVMTALTNTITSLQSKNYRVVSTLESVTDFHDKSAPFEADETIHIHVSSPAGNYYSWKDHIGSTEVECYSDICSFRCSDSNGSWTLRNAIKGNDHELRYRIFSDSAFHTLFGPYFYPLTKQFVDNDFVACCLPLDRTRTVVWGWDPKPKRDYSVSQFRAVVRFSEDRKRAYFERAETHHQSNSGVIDTNTTSHAKFVADTLEFHSGEETRSYFVIRAERNEEPRFILEKTYRYRVQASTDVTVSDDQLIPEYYGFDRKKLLKALAEHDPTQSVPADRADVLLAILIPGALLGVLYLIIRKT